jgi:hypothetical protein
MVREEFFAKHTVSEFVDLIWENLQSDRYGVGWAKLLLLYVGMPAERRSLDITIPTMFTSAELEGARHARIEAGREALEEVIEGQFQVHSNVEEGGGNDE